jgi:hypothetical protein
MTSNNNPSVWRQNLQIATPIAAPTWLEQRRDAAPRKVPPGHCPQWNLQKAGDRFTWIRDGERAVALLDAKEFNFELRAADPWSWCPPAKLPRHYHLPEYQGLRSTICWWLANWKRERIGAELHAAIEGDEVVFAVEEQWQDGSRGLHRGRLRYDVAWGRYVVECDAALKARQVIGAQEFTNLLPAGLSDSRPGREKYQHLLWLDGESTLRRRGKNPLWANAAGSADVTGRRCIPDGGFLAWGVEAQMNPVIEIVRADPPVGAMTCDNLLDEHLMLAAPDARHCPDGWFHLNVQYRLFSLPQALAGVLCDEAQPLETGPFLAWKFQYAPTQGPIGADLTCIELPGQPFYRVADFNTPVSWDEPYSGQLWTASCDPRADLYYDRETGHTGHCSLRLRADGGQKRFYPCTGPTVHTEEGRRYRISGFIKTRGVVRAWLEAAEVLFRPERPVARHATAAVEADEDWTYVETCYTARGADAPFAALFIAAEGDGFAWFDEIAFEPLEGEDFI